MVGDGEQCVRIRRQIDPHHLSFFIHHMIDESRVLVAEAIMVLAPDMRSEQVIQRRDWPPPRNVPGDLEPFGVLIEHRVNDVDECFVAGEEPVPSRQQISLQPPLALVFAQHLHYPAIRRNMVVLRDLLGG